MAISSVNDANAQILNLAKKIGNNSESANNAYLRAVESGDQAAIARATIRKQQADQVLSGLLSFVQKDNDLKEKIFAMLR